MYQIKGDSEPFHSRVLTCYFAIGVTFAIFNFYPNTIKINQMNDEQKQAIYNVLLEYFESKYYGYKINLHIEYMADMFPDITKEVVKDLKRKLLY